MMKMQMGHMMDHTRAGPGAVMWPMMKERD